LNILIVTQYFWPESFKINDLALSLQERGHKITVLTGQPNYPSGQFFKGYGFFRNISEQYGAVKVIRAPLLPRGNATWLRLAVNYASFILFASLTGLLRCRAHYDVIFVYAPSPITVALPALLLKKIKEIPLILWVQDLWPESLTAVGLVTPPTILYLVEKLVKYIYRSCDQILVTSQGFRKSINKYDKNEDHISYFPQYSEDFYCVVNLPLDAPARLKMPNGFIVMFAGNIGAAQDFETIIATAEMLRNYRDIHLVVIGDGRMRGWSEEMVSFLGLQETVHFLGPHPMDEMAGFFSLADAMLVTLKNEPIFSLTIPAKIQSYLACGRPIVAALNGEAAKIKVDYGSGFVCPADNPEAHAAMVLKMWSCSATERDAMGKSGLDYYAQNFDRAKLLDRLEDWIEYTISKNKANLSAP